MKKFVSYLKRKLAEFIYPEISKIQGQKMYDIFSNSDYLKDDLDKL